MKKIARRRFRIAVSLLAIGNLIISAIDLFAIYLFALIVSTLIKNESLSLPDLFLFKTFPTSNISREQSFSFGLITVVILISVKSFLILALSRFTLKYLSIEYSKNSRNLLEQLCRNGLVQMRESATYEIFLAINGGIKDIFLVGYNALINIFVECSLILVILILLFSNGGLPTILLSIYFVLTFLIVGRLTGAVNSYQSARFTEYNLNAALSVQTIVESFREIRIFNSIHHFIKQYSSAVSKSAESSAKLQYVSYIPKLIIEGTFILGVATFTWLEILTGNLNGALAEISFFVAMGSRMIPSLVRLQFGISQIRQIQGSSKYSQILFTKDGIEFSKTVTNHIEVSKPTEHPVFDLELRAVSYRYPKSDRDAVKNFSTTLNHGESLGIVGPSGSGKSTLVDLILGAIKPTEGTILIRNCSPETLIRDSEFKIGFVPQSISLIDGTMAENILLGRDYSKYQEEDFNLALERAGLTEFINSSSEGLSRNLTRAGSELSGGQKQQMGLARAFLDKPKILILDEATSSLDQESENFINQVIESLKGNITLIVIAHRLTTIRNLDKLILMENGQLIAEGNFEQLTKLNSTFRNFVKYSQV